MILDHRLSVHLHFRDVNGQDGDVADLLDGEEVRSAAQQLPSVGDDVARCPRRRGSGVADPTEMDYDDEDRLDDRSPEMTTVRARPRTHAGRDVPRCHAIYDSLSPAWRGERGAATPSTLFLPRPSARVTPRPGRASASGGRGSHFIASSVVSLFPHAAAAPVRAARAGTTTTRARARPPTRASP